jgi:acyl carrier protein
VETGGLSVSTEPSATEIIRTAWCTVLGIETAAPSDDFFASGGHSFAAVQLMTAVEASIPIDFPLEILFSDTLEAVTKECELRLAERKGDA